MEKEEHSQKKPLKEILEKSENKHYLLKTHKSHKWIIGIIILVMFVMGYGLYTKVMEIDKLSEDNFRILSIGLLFSLNIVVMILIVLLATFYIEIKDKYLQE